MAGKKDDPAPGERMHFGFRMTPDMKARIEAAAKASGRSMSQEAEFRLERSFERADLLKDVLSLTYGRELAGVLICVASAMSQAGSNSLAKPGRQGDWINDPFAFDQAVKTASRILEALRPKGEPTPGNRDADWWNVISGVMLLAIAGDRRGQMFEGEGALARELLRPETVKRIKAELKS